MRLTIYSARAAGESVLDLGKPSTSCRFDTEKMRPRAAIQIGLRCNNRA
jgi:hypothetical protein